MTAVGFSLQPDDEFLGRLEGLIHDEPDYYEVAPETLWAPRRDGTVVPNGFFRRFARLREETRRPFVAHGVGLSLASQSRGDAARQRQHLKRVGADHRTLDFLWYSDHLGISAPAGAAATLPLPIPLVPELAATVRRRLRAMRRVVPEVGFENAVGYFVLGDPMDEPAFIRELLRGPGTHLVLDLHNVHTMATNLGFDARDWVARLPLERVIEIHVSGGSESDPHWLPAGRTLRLDSHDGPVPEAVWRLLAEVLPRCPGLRGVTLERMEGTLADGDEKLLRDELRQVRRLVRRAGRSVA